MMAVMSKNVFIVNCDRKTFESSFSKKKNSDIINQYEIFQKLTNNDSSKIPPSEEIVNFQIIKKLNNFKICRKTEFVYFLKEKVDRKFIKNLKNLFSNCNVPVYFHLLIDSEDKKGFIKEFNTVQVLEDDKATSTG
jgi:hypothetical protein